MKLDLRIFRNAEGSDSGRDARVYGLLADCPWHSIDTFSSPCIETIAALAGGSPRMYSQTHRTARVRPVQRATSGSASDDAVTARGALQSVADPAVCTDERTRGGSIGNRSLLGS
jgi:hypothetical protein